MKADGIKIEPRDGVIANPKEKKGGWMIEERGGGKSEGEGTERGGERERERERERESASIYSLQLWTKRSK